MSRAQPLLEEPTDWLGPHDSPTCAGFQTHGGVMVAGSPSDFYYFQVASG